MLMNKRKARILAGDSEGFSQEEINRTWFFYNLHRDPVIKIDGKILGTVTSLDFQLSREEFEDLPPFKGKFEFTGDFTSLEIDEELLKILTENDKDEDNNEL